MDKDKEPIKQLYKKVYKEYSTKFSGINFYNHIKFFTWEKVEPDAEYKKEPKRRN